MNGQRRGESRGAERHRAKCVETGGHRDHALGRHPRDLGVSAVEGFRQAAARDQHRVAALEARIAGRFHDARQIDAADQRIAAQDLAGAGGRQRVLVVDVGELHVDDDFAGRQRVERQVFETRGNLSAGFVNAECLEGGHELSYSGGSVQRQEVADVG